MLVNKLDFYNEYTRENLQATLKELLDLNIIPILNTNDAIASKPGKELDVKGVISINDNDSLAARVAALIHSDLLLIMSDVDGLYDRPPSEPGCHLLSTVNPLETQVEFGDKSDVGTGGMESKVAAATWALQHNCSTVICNGQQENAILDTIAGKSIGTFFSLVGAERADCVGKEQMARKAREGARRLQRLSADERAAVVADYAKRLKLHQDEILQANALDLKLATDNGKKCQSSIWSRALE